MTARLAGHQEGHVRGADGRADRHGSAPAAGGGAGPRLRDRAADAVAEGW